MEIGRIPRAHSCARTVYSWGTIQRMGQSPKHLAKHDSGQAAHQSAQPSTPRHLKNKSADAFQQESSAATHQHAARKLSIPSVDAAPTESSRPAQRQAAKPDQLPTAAKRKRKKWPIVLVVIIVLLLALAGGSAVAWSHGLFKDTALGPLSDRIATLIVGQRFDTETTVEAVEEGVLEETADICKEDLAETEEVVEYQVAHDGFPTPLVAEYDGVLIHSPVHPSKLNGILFHQASTKYGLPLETKLPEADEEKVFKTKSYDFAKAEDQTEGDEYLKGKALHLWRRWTPTEMDTSIDMGAEAGDTVYAPVTGTVVLVRTYRLYNTCDDYEIHIQPDGRDDLDVVEIHITDVTVKAGDKVVGGVTPMAKVRDLSKEKITDIQLAYYTKPGHGNHTHVQVNDTNWKDKDGKTYKELRLKDAIEV